MSILIEDSRGQQPEQGDLQDWADLGDMETIPVLQNRTSSDYVPWIEYEQDWGIPTTVILGPGMEVLSVDEMVTSPERYL